jgi:hypothetical protein
MSNMRSASSKTKKLNKNRKIKNLFLRLNGHVRAPESANLSD